MISARICLPSKMVTGIGFVPVSISISAALCLNKYLVSDFDGKTASRQVNSVLFNSSLELLEFIEHATSQLPVLRWFDSVDVVNDTSSIVPYPPNPRRTRGQEKPHGTAEMDSPKPPAGPSVP